MQKYSKDILLKKFKILEKFQNQSWISQEAIKSDCNHKEIPLNCAFFMITDLLKFIEETKFNNNWEQGFSLKIRLNQIKDLLEYFCEDTEEEKTKKGSNLQ